ncbi:MAG: hypothetical protein HC888_15700 [Candidatus Competibacteraceae bacterium]|nr:hypothetical protein [Candidatus Competibacteraceae bacterium]
MLLLLLAVACVVGLAGPFSALRAVHTDELFSLITAELPPREMIERLAAYEPGFYDHPPLFFLLVRAMLVFGTEPFVIRLPSLIFAAFAIWVTGIIIARETQKPALAFLAVFVMAANPIVWEMAHFARMYSLVLLLGALTTGLVLDVLRTEERRRLARLAILLGLTLAVMLWTTYFTLVLCASLGLLALSLLALEFWRNKRLSFGGVAILAACAISGVLFLPWLQPTLRLLEAEGGEARGILFGFLTMVRAVSAAAGSPYVLLLVLVALAVVSVKSRQRQLFMVIFFLALPLWIMATKAPPDRPVVARYAMYGLPALFVFMAVVFADASDWLQERLAKKDTPLGLWRIPCGVLLLCYVGLQSLGFRQLANPLAPDWWMISAAIETQYEPGEIVLTGGFLSGEAIVYHMIEPETIEFRHYVTAIDPFYLSCRDPNVVWYVNAAPLPESFEKIIHRYFPYRLHVEGNSARGLEILVAAKKPFLVPRAGEAVYHEPVPLEYEQ